MIPQRTDEWRKQRIGKITSSRIGAILGHNEYQSQNCVMREMIREYFNCDDEKGINIAMQWGKDNEDVALKQYEKETNNFVIASEFIKDNTYDFIGGSPDGLIDEKGMLEIKCPYIASLESIVNNKSYYDQIQLLLYVTKRTWCDLFVWKPNQILCVKIKNDELWQEDSLPKMKEFYNKFISTVNDKEKRQPYLEDIYKKIDDDNDQQLSLLCDDYADLHAMEKYIQQKKDETKNEITEIIDNKYNGKQIITPSLKTTNVSKRGSIDYKNIAEKFMPKDIDLEKHRKKSSEYRMFKCRN